MGSDYLQTAAGTTFAGFPFAGVPIGPGGADTIVRRPFDAVLPGIPGGVTVPIELVALQLVSVQPIDLGAGLDHYYITLQSVRGGPASTGSMTIQMQILDDNLPGTPQGTFDSFFDVFFDIRIGSLNGPIVNSQVLTLTSQGTPWDANPSPLDLLVNGLAGDAAANWHTNKGTGQLDFFPGPISESHPSGAVHNATLASIPEPGTFGLMLAGLAALGACFARRRQ
jgi:hypothetical protein